MSIKTYPGDIKLAAGHLERAIELDPSIADRLRPAPKRTAQAFDEAHIHRLVERAMRKEMTMNRRPTRRHAFDDDGPSLSDLREAHSNLKGACDALGEMIDAKKFSFSQARDHTQAAMEHAGTIHKLLGGGETEDEEGGPLDDAEREEASRAAQDDEEKGLGKSDPPRSMTSGNGRSADIGMSRAESAVSLKGVRSGGDHRKDFDSIKQGGADSAHGFDIHSLFQRDADSEPRRSTSPVRKPARATTRARDTASELEKHYSLESLFQRSR